MANTNAATGRSDIDAAKEQMRATLGASREIERLVGHLRTGEKVELLTTATHRAGDGLLALTNRRLVFIRERWSKPAIEESYPLEEISSISQSSGLLLSSLTIYSDGNSIELKSLDRDDAKEIGTRLDEYRRQHQATSSTVGAAQPTRREVES